LLEEPKKYLETIDSAVGELELLEAVELLIAFLKEHPETRNHAIQVGFPLHSPLT